MDARTESPRIPTLARESHYVVVIGEERPGDGVLAALRSAARDYIPLPPSRSDLLGAIDRRGLARHDVVACLEYHTEHGEKRHLPIRETSSVTIGRDNANDICFNSQVVSRHHARLDANDGRYTVSDQGSRHGVLVNDERIAAPATLRDGDRIRLGRPSAPTLTFRHCPPPRDPSKETTSAAPIPNRELREVAALLDTFLTLNTDLLLEDVLSLVLTKAMEFANAERGLILLTEDMASESMGLAFTKITLGPEGEQRLILALARDRGGDPLDTTELGISQKIPAAVLTTGEGVILEDLLIESQAQHHVDTIDLGVRSAMCVPLVAPSRGAEELHASGPFGVLYVDSGSRSRPFSAHLLQALQSLVAEAARAIVNARLYQVSLEKRRIDEEVAIARTIQTNLLPPETYENDDVELKGTSRPSLEVGGDLIEYYPVDTGLGLLVGDVSGKGISAALFSAMLDGHFHAMVSLLRDRRDIPGRAAELNRFLVRRSGGEKFVTFIFGLLQPDGTFDYLNAGHNPALLVRAGGEVERLPAGGTIMGMLEESSYEPGHVQLAPGDCLVLYSDGVTEARGPERDLFTVDRLLDVVVSHRDETAAAIHDAVIDAVDRFTGFATPSDDVTLLIAKRRTGAR